MKMKTVQSPKFKVQGRASGGLRLLSLRDFGLWTLGLGLLLVPLARAEDRSSTPKSDVQTVSGFQVPEYDDEGNLKSKLFGDFAKVLPEGVIEISQLRIEFYEKGHVNMTVTAPRCLYDQKKGSAESDADVRIAREDMVVTGKGFSWNNKDQVFQILTQAKVVVKQAREKMNTGVQK